MAEEKEILTLQQAKDYLRVSYDEDDEEIEGQIMKATKTTKKGGELPPCFKRRSLAICTK